MLIFGGHSPFAIEMANQLSEFNEVHCITRKTSFKLISSLNNKVQIVEQDLHQIASKGIEDAKFIDLLRNAHFVIFAHRYRGADEDIIQSISTEVVGPYRLIKQSVESNDNLRGVFFFCSPAARRVVDDQGIAYHLGKAGVESLIRFLSVIYAKRHLAFIGLSIGSYVEKERSKQFYTEHLDLKEAITNTIPTGEFVKVSEICTLIKDLIECSNLRLLSGNILELDNRMALLEFSSTVRSLVSNRK